MTVDGHVRQRPLGKLAIPVYMPAAIYSIGNGAVTPMIAVTAHDLGASLSMSGLIAGFPLLGRLLADAPSGTFIDRVGERTAMIISGVITLISSLAVVFVQTLSVLAVSGVLMGAASAVFMLARHALVTDVVDPVFRGRALAMLAGMARLGMSVGPFLTAALIGTLGSVTAYWIQVVSSLGVIVFLMVVPDPQVKTEHAKVAHTHGSTGVFREHSGVLLRLGTGISVLMLLRMSRPIIVPLWGLSIGLSSSTIALAMGVGGLLEAVLFYTAGQIADRFGRIWVAVPVTLGMAVGHIALVLAHSVVTYFVVVMIIAFANSLGGGIMMLMGSDLAVNSGRTSEFLGVWRLFSDGAAVMAPVIIAGSTAVASLGLAAVMIGSLGLGGAGMLLRWMPRYAEPRR